MATIVEYSAEKPARNGYPKKIVSPPFPSPCCATRMRQVGNEQEENGQRFVYRRCSICGYTVRHFQAKELPRELPSPMVLRYRLAGEVVAGVSDAAPAIPRVQGKRRGVQAEWWREGR